MRKDTLKGKMATVNLIVEYMYPKSLLTTRIGCYPEYPEYPEKLELDSIINVSCMMTHNQPSDLI